MFGNTASNKSNIFEKGWCKFVSKNFIPDYFSIDWENLLNSDELSGDNSTQLYLETVSLLLDTYVPFKRFDKCKCKSKPWITLGLQKSISVENKLLTKFCNKKNPMPKEEIQIKCENYRNLLSTHMK